MWGEILGAAVGPIAETILGPVMANEQWQRSKYVSNRQMSSAKFLAENQPSWAAQGLRNAGFNPILAASRGFPGADFAPSSPGPSVSSGSLSGVASSAAQLKRLGPELQLLENTTKKVANEAEAAGYAIGTEASRAEGEYQRALEAEKRVDQVTELVELVRQQQTATAASARASNANAYLLEQEAAGAKALNDLYRDWPEARLLSLPGAAGYLGAGKSLLDRIPDAKWRDER